MAGKKSVDSAKKAAGNARKAEVAAQKAVVQERKEEAAEEERWQKGAKSSSKKEAEENKKAELAKKKAEKDALRAQEEEEIGGRAEPKNKKAPAKRQGGGLDLSQLDDTGTSTPSALNATGIDNALDALSLTGAKEEGKVDRHPERRYPGALAKFEERRLEEMKKDGSGVGLRLDQRKNRIRKEFEKHPDNPFNQISAAFNATKGDIASIKSQEKAKIEARLGK